MKSLILLGLVIISLFHQSESQCLWGSFDPPVSLDDPRCQPEYFEENFPCQNCACSEDGEYFDCCQRSSAMRPQVRDSDNCAVVFDNEECTWSLTPASTDNQEACDVVGMVG